jgi:hypothetical protein
MFKKEDGAGYEARHSGKNRASRLFLQGGEQRSF